MHADEVHTDAALVRRLLAAQFPQWVGLPIEPVRSAGTDNTLYRLGDHMAVRLPRKPSAAGPRVEQEQRWLPRLAPLLPLAVPIPLADPGQAATELAHFIAALERIDPAGGPPPGPHNAFRGVPLARRDAQTRAALAALRGTLDTNAAAAAWEAALQTPPWDGAPVWIHGDLQPVNLLVQGGRLSAVIDWGCLGVGDPACDLMPAWSAFSADAREIFRAALQVDDATWARGRGWALSFGLIALPYYQSTNPVLAGIARRAIHEAIADHRRG
jgi:aminoglycoside phosphotransferase (APT) family kinase protein